MVDMVTHRFQLKSTLARILRLLMQPNAAPSGLATIEPVVATPGLVEVIEDHSQIEVIDEDGKVTVVDTASPSEGDDHQVSSRDGRDDEHQQ